MYGNPTYEIDQKIKTLADSISYENQIKNDLLNLRKNMQGAPGYDYGPELIEQDKRIKMLENQIQQLKNQKNAYGNYSPQKPPVNNAAYYNQTVGNMANDMNNMHISQYSPPTQPQQYQQQYNYNAQNRLQPQIGAPPRSKSRVNAAPPRIAANPQPVYGMGNHSPPARPMMQSYTSPPNGPRITSYKPNIVQQPQHHPVRPPPPPLSQAGYTPQQNTYSNVQQPMQQGYIQARPPSAQVGYQQSYQQPQQNYQQSQQNYQQPQQSYQQTQQGYYQQAPAQPHPRTDVNYQANNYTQAQPQNNYQKGYAQPLQTANYQGNNYAQQQPSQGVNNYQQQQGNNYYPQNQQSPPQQKQPPLIPARTGVSSSAGLHIPPRGTVSQVSQPTSPLKSPQVSAYNSKKPSPSPRIPINDGYTNEKTSPSPRIPNNDGYSNEKPSPSPRTPNKDGYTNGKPAYDQENHGNKSNVKSPDNDYDYNYDYDYNNEDDDRAPPNDYAKNDKYSYNDDQLNEDKTLKNTDSNSYSSYADDKHKSIYSDKSGQSEDNLDLYLDLYGNDNKETNHSTTTTENKDDSSSLRENPSQKPSSINTKPPTNMNNNSPNLRLNTSQTNSPTVHSPRIASNVNSPRIPSTVNSPRIQSINSPRTTPNTNSPKPNIVIPPRTRVQPPPRTDGASTKTTPTSTAFKPHPSSDPKEPAIPPRQTKISQPSIPMRTASTVNLDAYDFITAPDQLDNEGIMHRIKKIQTKLEIENKYKIGSEKAIDVMKMSGTSKSSPQYNEAQMRLRESNEKIKCLTDAKINYENKYSGPKIEKDLTEYPVNDVDSQPQRNTLIKTLGRIRNAQTEGKLQMKFICIQKLTCEVAAIIYVNGRFQNQTRISKGNQWNFEVDIFATKDAEIEIIFENDKKNIIGLLWFKASDLEEAAKLKYAESHDINDNTYALQVEPIGELIIQLTYLRDNANFPTGTLHPGIHRRKAANKMLIYQQGHKLAKLQNYNILKCAMCGEFILSGSGLQCAECNYACHQNCVPMITSKCISQSKSEQEEQKNDPLTLFISKFNIPHRFKIVNNVTTGWCSHCGQMLPIGKNSILKCTECHQICHHGCKIFMQNLCGLSMDMVKGFTSAIEKTEREKKRTQVAELQRHHKTLIRKPPPTLKKREVTLNDFHFMVVLGRGNFGKVMLAEEKTTKRLYAIKTLKKQTIIDDDEVQSMMNEKSAFLAASQINHPFLVNLHSCFTTSSRVYFVMEYAQCGDLISHIGKKNFTKARAKFYLCEVLLALEYLHSKDIIYRDLKLDNILLTIEGHIKLTDFGLCKGNMTWNATTKTFCGTPEFIAPEILIGAPYTRAVDWWTFGVLIYEMIVKEAPFSGDDDEEIFDNIINKQPSYPQSMGKSTMAVCRGLLKKKPNQRLGYSSADAKEIKKQDFFNDVDWQAMLEKRIPPPYVPSLKSKADVSLFDEEFTKEPPVLTPVQCYLDPFEQELFDGFAYVNPYLVTDQQ